MKVTVEATLVKYTTWGAVKVDPLSQEELECLLEFHEDLSITLWQRDNTLVSTPTRTTNTQFRSHVSQISHLDYIENNLRIIFQAPDTGEPLGSFQVRTAGGKVPAHLW
jgi:hypothetical protein